MMNGHAVNRRQAVIVGRVQHDNVKNEGGVGRLDLVLRSEVNGNIVFPILELLIKLSNRIEKLAG